MTTAVYYRVSTEEQSLDMQRVAVQRFLQEKSYSDDIREYQDLAMSGAKIDRPGFLKMLSDVSKGKIKAVIVYKLDRLTRDAHTAIDLVLKFDKLGVEFISVTQPMFQPGTPFRHAIIAIFAELAQMERQMIVDRVKAGLDAARKRGVKLGAPIKARGPEVEKILYLRAQRKSFKAISKEVGLAVGTVWKVCQAAGILNEPTIDDLKE